MLARGLTTAESSAIRAAIDGGTLAQVRLEPEAVRVYPLDGGDPAAVEQIKRAGVGARVTIPLGGKTDMPALGLKGRPRTVTARAMPVEFQ